MNFFRKIFPTYNDRKNSQYMKIVEEINEAFDKLVSDESTDPKAITENFRERLSEGEAIDDIMPEAFALVKYVMHTLKKEHFSYSDGDMHFIWDMVPYDVQMIGAIALHKGTIIEMATGEGKTLVAVMPLYLNALAGKGSYLVTVNDYLAKRDRAWMNPVYERLGLTVGLIQMGMTPVERRENYNMDITYVTNNELGFDYLRDNMTYQKKDKVHRDEYFYAIIDEVDSVLIDEARTPLIISGLPFDNADEKRTYKIYSEINEHVSALVKKQKMIVQDFFKQAKSSYDSGDTEKGTKLYLTVKRGYPKMKELVSAMQDADLLSRMERMENAYIRDKILHTLDAELLFSIDEKSGAVNITDMGEDTFCGLTHNETFFTLPEIPVEYKLIDDNEEMSDEEKLEKKNIIMDDYIAKSEYIHALHQLLKAYTLFEKDVEYIVQNGKVIIVDEHTGRLMPGRRFSEGLHSAIEAKERVQIEEETKTLATITLQNLFRMFEKLSGMTGTAETEANEFMQIYKLPVQVIPTNRPVIRRDINDIIFIRKEDKTKHIIERIMKLHNSGVPVLVGTASVASSEYLDKRLKVQKDIAGKNIKYSILNAKNNEKEALIVAEAGQQGAVTIATNMAGRGTDIKLGSTIKMLPERSVLIEAIMRSEKGSGNIAVICKNPLSIEYIEHLLQHDEFLMDKKLRFNLLSKPEGSLIGILPEERKDEIQGMQCTVLNCPDPEKLSERNVCISFDEKGVCREYAPAGLYVLGTEKHESRRIDRQLRGRSGRQGDPGASLFTVSLEDDLMRIFGNEKMSDLIRRLETMSDTETAVSHRLLTTSIETAQKRIEGLNFDRRKYLLEYDDVLNKQREVVYELRNFFIYRNPPFEYVNSSLFEQLTANLNAQLKEIFNNDDIISANRMLKHINNTFQINLQREELRSAAVKSKLGELIKENVEKDIEVNFKEAETYIMETVPQIAYDFISDMVPRASETEEWPIERINEFLLNYFKFTVPVPEAGSQAEQFAETVREKVVEQFKRRIYNFSADKSKLLYFISVTFIRAIDKLWVEQLYELDAIKEGISLRGYAQKDPLVEYKREAYELFGKLMDDIFKEFSEEFFRFTSKENVSAVKEKRIEAVKKDAVFANTSESEEAPKEKPVMRENPKIGRNDPCWCGSGKKYKNCHGKTSDGPK